MEREANECEYTYYVYKRINKSDAKQFIFIDAVP